MVTLAVDWDDLGLQVYEFPSIKTAAAWATCVPSEGLPLNIRCDGDLVWEVEQPHARQRLQEIAGDSKALPFPESDSAP